MATLDWSQCPAVESMPGRLSGASVFRDTRMPVSAVFENLESGATVEEIAAWFHLAPEHVATVLEFAARSLDAPVPSPSPFTEGTIEDGKIRLPPNVHLPDNAK